MLCAIIASIYLGTMGPEGLREAAAQSIQKAHYLRDGLIKIKGMKQRYPDTPFFNEFVIDSDRDPAEIDKLVMNRGIVGGLPLRTVNKEDTGVLYCATEMNRRCDMDALLGALEVKA
jgi:glycine dehydrogenase subunit 1